MPEPLISEERIAELAAGVFARLVGKNDEIANDPSRWGEPMRSWGRDEFETALAQAMRVVARETAEACATLCEEMQAEKQRNIREGQWLTLGTVEISGREFAAEIRRRAGGEK